MKISKPPKRGAGEGRVAGEDFGERGAMMAHTWVEIDERARIVLDAAGHLIWSNSRANAVLTDGHRVCLRDLALHFTSQTAQRDFEHFIARLSSDPATIMLEPGSPRGAILIRAWQVTNAMGAHAWIELAFGESDRPLAYFDLERVFRLTRAEHRAALALLEGRSPTEIATAHAVSLDTVRSQIKSIYAKVGVNNRDVFHSRMRRYQIG